MAIAKTRSLVILFVLFLMLLVYTLPARLVVPVLTPESAGVYLQNIDGFWHKGTASSVNIYVAGVAVPLQNMSWDCSLLSLLVGRLSADIRAEFSGKPIEFTASRSAGGDLSVDNLFADINFDDIRPLMRQLIVPIDGGLILRDVELGYNGSWFEHLDGRAQLTNLVTEMPIGPLEIGDITFLLSTAEDGSNADERNVSGKLQADIIEYQGSYGLDGSVFMQQNGALEAFLTSMPDSTVPPMIVQQMSMIFGPPTNGQFTFNYSDE